MSTAATIHSPAAVEQFLRETAEPEIERQERRGTPRYLLQIPVRVSPLDERMQSDSPPYYATCCNISCRGISFLHTRAVTNKYLLVEITASGRRMRLLVEVLRCQRKGRFYEVAGQFVTRLPEAAETAEPEPRKP